MSAVMEPWPWYVAGPLLSMVLFCMLYFGKTFGFSSNLRTICSIGGAGKVASFFDFNWRGQIWNLTFLVGTVLGAWIATQHLMNDHKIDLNPKTVASLETMNINAEVNSYVPNEIFDLSENGTKAVAILIIGGLLIGFGTRWAGGCTSGHSITGLSNLQLPSLIATIGFFAGGLLMTHILLPLIFGS